MFSTALFPARHFANAFPSASFRRKSPLLQLLASSIALSNSFAGFHGQNGNSAGFNTGPLVLRPNAQLSVGAFPQHANDAAKILLRD
jgi:hypothetical protein